MRGTFLIFLRTHAVKKKKGKQKEQRPTRRYVDILMPCVNLKICTLINFSASPRDFRSGRRANHISNYSRWKNCAGPFFRHSRTNRRRHASFWTDVGRYEIQVNRWYRTTSPKHSRAGFPRIPDLYPLKHRIAITCAASRSHVLRHTTIHLYKYI